MLELCAAGSLDLVLPSLTWYQRIRVATHVARALLFLHMRRPEVRCRGVLLSTLLPMSTAQHTIPALALFHARNQHRTHDVQRVVEQGHCSGFRRGMSLAADLWPGHERRR